MDIEDVNKILAPFMALTIIDKERIKLFLYSQQSKIEQLEQDVADTENALTGAIDCINKLKCCGNCGTTSKYIICQYCIRYNGFTKDCLVDKWSKKEE